MTLKCFPDEVRTWRALGEQWAEARREEMEVELWNARKTETTFSGRAALRGWIACDKRNRTGCFKVRSHQAK